MDLELLNIAIALSEQEQEQDLCAVTNEPHDFDYYYTDGEKVCWDCGLIDSKPKPSTLPGSLCYESVGRAYTPRSRNKYSYKTYLKKCIDLHEEQNNCSIPYEVYEDFRRFRITFLQRFPNEPKISTRYILYRLAKRYDHPCPESSFVNIKHQKTKERYEPICNQIFGY